MATITKRGDTYRIRTSCGYDVNGKQVMRSMTYKPQPGMSDKQIEKEVNRQAVLFEEQNKQGQVLTAAKFETFAREWFKDYAEIKLKRLTLCSYHRMERRMYEEIGHIRVDRISPLDIQRYIRSLINEGLASNSVKNHVRLVSVILNYAIKKRVIQYNPCVTADFPKNEETELDFYSMDEARQFLELLSKEKQSNFQYEVFFTLAIYTGCRRGELLGLEWKDVDFDNSVISINRAYYYDSWDKVEYTDTPKSATSKRSLKLPEHVMQTLTKLHEWQDQRREVAGGSWIETDRLFTNRDGQSLTTTAPEYFFRRFCDRTGMRKVKIHSFCHFNARVLINSGVDVVSVQNALGHSQASTTLNFYSHAFNTLQTRVMEAVSNAINLQQPSVT